MDSRHFRARIVHVHELPRAGHQESLVCAGNVTPGPHDRAPVVDTKGQRIRRARYINGRILATFLDEPVLRVARIRRVAYDLSLTIDADGKCAVRLRSGHIRKEYESLVGCQIQATPKVSPTATPASLIP